MIARSIIGPIRNAAAFADRIANSDLSSSMEAEGQDELGDLLRSLLQMQNNLPATVTQIKQGTETITVASQKLPAVMRICQAVPESQAGSLEETASSMEELTSTVKQNADNARQANQLVVSATQVAVRGGDGERSGDDDGVNQRQLQKDC
jgi:methyl-accepting chemotaxis protein